MREEVLPFDSHLFDLHLGCAEIVQKINLSPFSALQPYFAGDPYIAKDPRASVHPDNVIVLEVDDKVRRGVFDIVLARGF